MSVRVPCLVLLLVLLPLCVSLRGDEDVGAVVTWHRYDGYLPDQDYREAAVLLVRDARTGRPIEGARIRRCPEYQLDAEAGWAPVWEETTTDEFGLAWIVHDPDEEYVTVDPETGEQTPLDWGSWTAHWVVDAPGYAPTEEYGQSVQEVVELEPGVDLQGRVVGPFGRPAPGIQVEFKVGCAHAPAMRTAVTDTAGRFSLPCIGRIGDLCLEGPGVLADYRDPDELAPPGFDPPVLQMTPGATIRGRIVGPDRAWLAEARVQSRTSSRGPMARVSPDGRFRLEGADPGALLKLIHHGEEEEVEAELDASLYRPGVPLVWYHPESPSRAERVEVTLRVRRPQTASEAEAVVVHLDRRTDGRRHDVAVALGADPESEDRLAVPEGEYDLSAGSPFAPYVAPPTRVRVAVSGNTTFDVSLVPQPRLALQGLDSVPDEATVLLCLADRDEGVDDRSHPDERWPLHLPSEAEAAVLVSHLDGHRAFPVGPVREGVRTVRIDWPRTATVKVLGLHSSHASSEGALPSVDDVYLNGALLRDRGVNRDEGFTFRTYLEGRLRVEVESDQLGSGRAWCTVRPDAAAPVVVDDIEFAPGRPGVLHLAGVPAEVEEGPWCYVHVDGQSDLLVPDDDGAYRSALLREGASLRVDTHHVLLRGSGPYRIALGTASLVVEITAAEGEEPPLLYLDGQCGIGAFGSASGERPWRFRLPCLDAGVHRLIVGAPGHHALWTEVSLEEGEKRRLEVTLRLRR